MATDQMAADRWAVVLMVAVRAIQTMEAAWAAVVRWVADQWAADLMAAVPTAAVRAASDNLQNRAFVSPNFPLSLRKLQ